MLSGEKTSQRAKRDIIFADMAPMGVTDGKAEVAATPVTVECTGHLRCLAHRGKDGKWREFYKGDLLPEPVRIVDERSREEAPELFAGGVWRGACLGCAT